MHVTLIAPPWFFQKKLEFLSQNLGLGYLAAFLRKEGHEVTIIDSLAEGRHQAFPVYLKYEKAVRYGLSYEEIAERVPKQTGLIGIGVPFSNNRLIYEELAGVLKKFHPKIPLVGGGVYPSTQPERAMKAAVDGIIVGEGEIPLAALAAETPWESIPGLWFRKPDGNIVRNPGNNRIEDLDSIPFPARDLLPMKTYFSMSPRGLEDRRTAAVITSRGCPYDCTFCSVHPVYGRGFRKASASRVLEEIRALIDTYDIDHIEFEDDNFTLDVKRAEEVLDGLIEIRNTRKPITWEDPNGIRIDSLSKKFLEKASISGCRRLYLALEHGDEEMRRLMNKRLRSEDVIRVVRDAASVGLPMLLFTIVGYPGETRERFESGLSFCRHLRSLGADRFEVFIAKPYPGTQLMDLCQEREFLRYNDVEELVFNMDTVAIETPDFDAREVLRRRKKALFSLNPGIYRLKGPLSRILPRRVLREAKRFFRLK